MTTPRQHIEHNEQTKLVMWVRAFHPDLMLAAIPNGGHRRAMAAVKLKAEGVVAGMPDLCLLEPKNGLHGLFIEMKTEDGKVSEQQKKIHARLTERGYCVTVCRSFKEGQQAIIDYLKVAL